MFLKEALAQKKNIGQSHFFSGKNKVKWITFTLQTTKKSRNFPQKNPVTLLKGCVPHLKICYDRPSDIDVNQFIDEQRQGADNMDRNRRDLCNVEYLTDPGVGGPSGPKLVTHFFHHKNIHQRYSMLYIFIDMYNKHQKKNPADTGPLDQNADFLITARRLQEHTKYPRTTRRKLATSTLEAWQKVLQDDPKQHFSEDLVLIYIDLLRVWGVGDAGGLTAVIMPPINYHKLCTPNQKTWDRFRASRAYQTIRSEVEGHRLTLLLVGNCHWTLIIKALIPFEKNTRGRGALWTVLDQETKTCHCWENGIGKAIVRQYAKVKERLQEMMGWEPNAIRWVAHKQKRKRIVDGVFMLQATEAIYCNREKINWDDPSCHVDIIPFIHDDIMDVHGEVIRIITYFREGSC